MRKQVEEIVKIKKFREETALNEKFRREKLLEKAIQRVIDKQKELEDYKVWRVNKEKELYDQVIKKSVGVRKIEDIRYEVINIRLKEIDYVQAVEDAKLERENAKEALQEAKKLHMQAVRNTEKMSEVAKSVIEEEEKEQASAEEAELEEQAATISIGPGKEEKEEEEDWRT